jgi:ATP-dependent Clp protease protease subunit
MKRHNRYWGNLEVGMASPENSNQMIPPSNEPSQGQYPEVIEVVENRIYFYADIDRMNVLKLNKTIDTLNNDLLHKSIITSNNAPEIFLFINSFGGHIFDAFSALDTIIGSRIPINTVIDGCSASAATLISVVGHKRYIKPHSYFLIHQISSVMWGKYTEFKDEMENLDKFMSMIKKIYKKHTKLPMTKLEEILKHDLWFDAEEALEFGLVDEISK